MKSTASLSLKKKTRAAGIYLLVLLAIFVPSYALAAIVPCGGSGQSACNFNFFIILIKNIINFLIFKLAVPLAAISFAVAGVMILTAGGNEGQVSKAKEIFWNVLIGLIVALAAWLIVSSIIGALQSSSVPSYLQ